jgi:pimeloyl-ACP methyl ester carboxylesterase
MKNFEERQFELSGFRLAVKLWGSKNGRPLIAFPGMLDNAASFDLLAQHLPDRYIAAIDFPGTGYSSHYPEGILPYWKGDAFLMLQLIEQLGWKEFDIIAHSLGSIIAVTVAGIIPEKVCKFVLLDVLGPIMAFQDRASDYLTKSADKGGHHLHLDNPEPVAAIIRDFLEL